jgi:hypothetical protein
MGQGALQGRERHDLDLLRFHFGNVAQWLEYLFGLLVWAVPASDQYTKEIPDSVDLYHWARNLAMRVAMRALFGFDPDGSHADRVADLFQRGLSVHEREFPLQLLVGPFTPHATLVKARRELEERLTTEIRRRHEAYPLNKVSTAPQSHPWSSCRW